MANAIRNLFGIHVDEDPIKKHKKLRRCLIHLQEKEDALQKIQDDLREEYRDCKQDCFIGRYKELKRMIKTAVEQHDNVRAESGDDTTEESEENAAEGLLQINEKLAKNAAKIKEEARFYSELTSKQAKDEILELPGMIQKSEEEVERMEKKLNELNDDYKHYKNSHPLKRYRAMKRMIKKCTRNEDTKNETT